MKRRSFLAALSAFTLDPERLLWVPGAKTISIPRPKPLITWDIERRAGGRVFFYEDGVRTLSAFPLEIVTRVDFFTKWPEYVAAILAAPPESQGTDWLIR